MNRLYNSDGQKGTFMKNVFILIRGHQWIKNLFVFAPVFFAGQITDSELFPKALFAFVAFCLTASAIYVFNDLQDIEEDRGHPTKCKRPLASGEISARTAKVTMIVLLIAGAAIMASVSVDALAILSGYVALNIGYSLKLKHIAIMDVTIIAVGFVLRLFAGSAATSTPLSMWVVMMTFLLALFLALAKRRDDILHFLNTGQKARKVVDGYNLQLIDGAMTIMASVVIVAYIMYATSAAVVDRLGTENLYLTALFVILGILRYLQIAYVEGKSGSPTKIVLTDVFMQVSIIAWAVSFVWIIYL